MAMINILLLDLYGSIGSTQTPHNWKSAFAVVSPGTALQHAPLGIRRTYIIIVPSGAASFLSSLCFASTAQPPLFRGYTAPYRQLLRRGEYPEASFRRAVDRSLQYRQSDC